MIDAARVKMFGMPIGTLRLDNRYDVVSFQYDDLFANQGIEPAPLMMPVRKGVVYSFGNLERITYQGLPGMIADSLPDTYGRALFEKWLSLNGRTGGNVIESLCYLGSRCMGALEFEPALLADSKPDMSFEIDSLVDVASEALAEKESFSTNLSNDRKSAIAEILRLGTSAGGQRAKAVIAYNKTTGEVRSGQIPAPDGFDYYLIKLDGVSATAGFKETGNYGRLEYSFYKLAQKCGIDMTECSILEENGRAHFMTKRFDRSGGQKLHMQTLCGIAHFDYRIHRAYSYEQAFGVMRMLKLSYQEISQLFRRMVFNVVFRNQDDHTKNISFLMDSNGIWRLSPAYDMGYSYNPSGGWTSTHQMSINNKFDDIIRKDLLVCASANGIKDGSEIIDEVSDAISLWPDLARECGVPQKMIDGIASNFIRL
ncbi:MAG: type II toxin-antitoxin system HipA family toxin [Bacteroidaceae bacterium]|nr:type II toxin-antitoxin system HipA family toxin [Bacteroidaceae bacterium]